MAFFANLGIKYLESRNSATTVPAKKALPIEQPPMSRRGSEDSVSVPETSPGHSSLGSPAVSRPSTPAADATTEKQSPKLHDASQSLSGAHEGAEDTLGTTSRSPQPSTHEPETDKSTPRDGAEAALPELAGNTTSPSPSRKSIFGTDAGNSFIFGAATTSDTPQPASAQWPVTFKDQPHTILDPNGDALVHVSPFVRPFLVSSKSFAHLCKPWAKMVIHRRTMGPEESRSADRLEIELAGDDSFAVTILLHIAHLHFDKMPASLSLEQLFALLVLTDKYEATKVVRPWISDWLMVWMCAKERQRVCYIWIAWEFGLAEDFGRLANALVLGARIKDDPDSLTFHGYTLSNLVHHGSPIIFQHIEISSPTPPGLIGNEAFPSSRKTWKLTTNAESILDVRRTVINRLLGIASSYLNRCYLPVGPATGSHASGLQGFCRAQKDRAACHVSICGSIILGFQGVGISTSGPATPLGTSIAELSAAMKGFRIVHFDAETHAVCDPTQRIQQEVKDVLARMPSCVTPAHEAHLEKQRMILCRDGPSTSEGLSAERTSSPSHVPIFA